MKKVVEFSSMRFSIGAGEEDFEAEEDICKLHG